MLGHYILLFALWTALMDFSLELQLTENDMKDMKGKFCGDHLSAMLSVLCNGVYNNKQKRNMYRNLNNREDYQDIEPVEYSDDSLLAFPFRSRERAKAIIPIEFRKRSHGVATECCKKACSLWEMSSYCGDQ